MKKVQLKKLIDVSRGASLPGKLYSTSGDLIRLTLGNFDYVNNGFKVNTSKDNIYFTGQVSDEFVLNKGDIITPLTEQKEGLLGTTARIPESGKYIQSQDVGLITAISDDIIPDYMYYLLPSSLVKKQLSVGAQQTSIRHTSPDKIKDCFVFIPEKKQQERIVALLDDIERKIELAEEEYEALCLLGSTVFDYWFMQYDFPDANGKPYKSSGGEMVWCEQLKRNIPKGWKPSIIGKHVHPLERGVTYSSDEIKGRNGIPMLNLACYDKQGNYRSGELKYFSGAVSDDIKAFPGEMLIATTDMTRDADVIGRPIWVSKEYDEFVYSMDLVKITPKEDLLASFLYFTLKDKNYHRYIKPFASGTNVLHLNTQGILDYVFILPPKDLQTKFEDFYSGIKERSFVLRNEINALREYKNYVTPLFMNGQATIAD